MIQIVSEKPIPLKNFIVEFRHFFSKPVFNSFIIYFSGLFLELKRTNINRVRTLLRKMGLMAVVYFSAI